VGTVIAAIWPFRIRRLWCSAIWMVCPKDCCSAYCSLCDTTLKFSFGRGERIVTPIRDGPP